MFVKSRIMERFKLILFNRTILNFFHNFIPNKIILGDYRDPPWMNEKIKQLIKNKLYFKNKKRQTQ